MATTKAYVLEDGEVLSEKQMDKYLVKDKGQSNKLPSDKFDENYSGDGLVEPLYNIEALAQLLEINTYHYRAVKTKARDIAGLGWSLAPKEGLENPSKEDKERATKLLENCNPNKTFLELLDMVMVDLESTGNGYLEVIRGVDGEEVVGLEHIPTHTIRVHKDMERYVHKRGKSKVWFKTFNTGVDVHKDTGEVSSLGSLEVGERATEILHLKNYTSRSDYYGVPDILPALGAVLGDRGVQEYNISFFENHAVPAYAVTISGADLDEQTERDIKKFFQKDIKNSNHSTLVLTAQPPEGEYDAPPVEFNFQALSTETKEASFSVYRQGNRDEILSAHGVPPYRAGVVAEGQMGGSSARETTEIYKQSVVRPKQEMLESRINRFILQQGMEIEDWVLVLNEIDTRDEDREIERMKKLFDMGYYSPNMLREELGDEPVDDPAMDMHYIQGQPIGNRDLLDSVKSLHKELVQAVHKDAGNN